MGHAYRTQSAQLQAVAHQLSASRDADAALEIHERCSYALSHTVTRAIVTIALRVLSARNGTPRGGYASHA